MKPETLFILPPMKSKGVAIFLIVLLLVFAGVYVYFSYRKPKQVEKPVEQDVYIPPFRKDGDLVLYKGNGKDTLSTLRIEVADDEYEITTGLMYRRQMEKNQGMLFIFPDERMRSFWMKNTYIPLDIIFIAENRKIITIRPDTKPLSETSIPSTDKAKYVLEVNAGTAARIGLNEGDRIEFNLDTN